MSDEYEFDQRTLPKFAAFLHRKYHEMAMNYPGKTEFSSAVRFGEWLGIKQSTFSTWWTGSKTPSDEEVIRGMAAKLGRETYTALGRPAPMPDDPDLQVMITGAEALPKKVRREIVKKIWDNLSPRQQDKWYEMFKPYIAEDNGDTRSKTSLA